MIEGSVQRCSLANFPWLGCLPLRRLEGYRRRKMGEDGGRPAERAMSYLGCVLCRPIHVASIDMSEVHKNKTLTLSGKPDTVAGLSVCQGSWRLSGGATQGFSVSSVNASSPWCRLGYVPTRCIPCSVPPRFCCAWLDWIKADLHWRAGLYTILRYDAMALNGEVKNVTSSPGTTEMTDAHFFFFLFFFYICFWKNKHQIVSVT